MARVYYFNSALSRNTTTSTTPQDQLTLTFTPNASKVYLLLWGCLLDNNNVNSDSLARLYNATDAAALQTFNFEAKDVTDTYQVAAAVIYTAPGSPTSMDFKVQYYSESTNTTGCQDAWMAALELGAADFYSVTTAEQSNSGTVADIGPSVTVGAGSFLIIQSAEINASSTNPTAVRFSIDDGTTTVTEIGPPSQRDTSNYLPWWQIVRVQPGSSTTYKSRFTGGGGVSANARNTTLVALDLAEFSDVIYGESLGQSTTTSASAQTKLTVTDTPLAQDYLQLFSCSRDPSGSTTVSGLTDFARDGSPISVTASREPAQNSVYFDQGYGVISELTASSTSWTTRYWRESMGSDSKIKNAAFVALGLEDGSIDITVEPTGQGVTASQGSLATVIDAAFTLTGQSATSGQGSVSVVVGQLVTLTGQQATSAIGDLSTAFDMVFGITGQEATGAQGSVAVAADMVFGITGQGAAAAQGDVSIVSSPLVELTGQGVTAAQGSITAVFDALAAITGQGATAEQGSVSVSAATIVLLTGQYVTSYIGSVLVWGPIQPDQDPNWMPIVPGQTPGWSAMGGAGGSWAPVDTTQNADWDDIDDTPGSWTPIN